MNETLQKLMKLKRLCQKNLTKHNRAIAKKCNNTILAIGGKKYSNPIFRDITDIDMELLLQEEDQTF